MIVSNKVYHSFVKKKVFDTVKNNFPRKTLMNYLVVGCKQVLAIDFYKCFMGNPFLEMANTNPVLKRYLRSIFDAWKNIMEIILVNNKLGKKPDNLNQKSIVLIEYSLLMMQWCLPF